jgi:hypothetical protein
MIKYFKTFFQPKEEVYYYDSQCEIVVSKINEIFKVSNRFWTGNDMKGFFIDKYTFKIERRSRSAFPPKLIGQILKLENKTEIKTIIRTSNVFYIWFVLTILLGIFGLYNCIYTFSLKSLFVSIALIIAGPLLTIALSNFNVGLLTDRFKRHIDSNLRN